MFLMITLNLDNSYEQPRQKTITNFIKYNLYADAYKFIIDAQGYIQHNEHAEMPGLYYSIPNHTFILKEHMIYERSFNDECYFFFKNTTISALYRGSITTLLKKYRFAGYAIYRFAKMLKTCCIKGYIYSDHSISLFIATNLEESFITNYLLLYLYEISLFDYNLGLKNIVSSFNQTSFIPNQLTPTFLLDDNNNNNNNDKLKIPKNLEFHIKETEL